MGWLESLLVAEDFEFFFEILQLIILRGQFLLFGLKHWNHLKPNPDLVLLSQPTLHGRRIILLRDSWLTLAPLHLTTPYACQHVAFLILQFGEPVCLFWFLLSVLKYLFVTELIAVDVLRVGVV